MRILHRLVNNLELLAALLDRNLPIGRPIPDVNCHAVILNRCKVCFLWVVLKKYAHLAICAVVVAHGVEVKCSELTLCTAVGRGEETAAGYQQMAAKLFTKKYLENPSVLDEWEPRWVKNPSASAERIPFEPEFSCPESCFDLAAGEKKVAVFAVQDGAKVQAVLDTECLENLLGIEVPEDALPATEPFVLSKDARICAVSGLANGKKSEPVCKVYRFGWKDIVLRSNCNFVQRPVFDCGGIQNLLKEERGSTDWQDGKWLATQENLDFVCVLPEKRKISCVEVGFLTNHRSGIIYPEALELYAGEDEEHLELVDCIRLPEGPAKAEIAKEDFGFQVAIEARCIRFVAKRYDLMPQWCCYKGTPDVFTLADCLIIR